MQGSGQLAHLPEDLLSNIDITFKEFVDYEDEESEDIFETEDFDEVIEDPEVPDEEKIFKMKLLPRELLVYHLCNMLYFDNEFVPHNYLNYIMDTKDTGILVAPSNEDKILLLEVIISYINLYTDIELSDKVLNDIIKLYNDHNLQRIKIKDIKFIDILLSRSENSDLLYLTNATFCPNEFINKLKIAYNNMKPLSDEDKVIFRIQIFTYVSFWMDMDLLLISLHDYLETLPED